MEVRLVVEAEDELGEGPCWSAAEGRLYWFDIKGRRLHWLEPGGVAQARALPWRASAGAPRAAGGLLMATDAGLALFEASGESLELVRPLRLAPGFRTNDGKVDPLGRFWWSTMDDDGGRRPGAVHVTAADLATREVIGGIHIANATAFSPDGATLYLADSLRQTVFAYETADLSRRRVFAQTAGAAAPDGAAVDAEGGVWIAEWGGGRLVRYTPDGALARIVEVPVSQPSACAFGGPRLETLFITSAWEGLSRERRAREPMAGGLFAFEPGVPGWPIPPFGG